MEAAMNVEIVLFRPEHAGRFGELNREWLERYNLMEAANEEQLANPQAHFLGQGGQVFVALHGDDVIGTCAIVPHGVPGWEIAKLTVASAFQGQGIARRLVSRCIAFARENGAQRVYLVSNSQLQPALRLYESFGFEYRASPDVKEYQHQDVYMELQLETMDHPASREPTT
jgi:ribosomal protein S18 acetylase RimI-like enzyme